MRLAFAVYFLLFAVPNASADDVASSPPAASSGDAGERARGARVHFDAGMQHYQAGAFREAIREFALAASLVPSADLWFNIARSHERLAEWSDAAENYRRYLRDRVDPPDRATVSAHIVSLEERAEAERQSRRTAPTNGTLRIEASPAGATVSVDGTSIGEAPHTESLSLPSSRHLFALDHDGSIPVRSEVRVDPGVATTVFLSTSPATEYRAVRGSRLWTWVVTGLAGAGLATSVGMGVHAKLEVDAAAYGSARAWANRSDAVLAGSVITAIGAIVLYFVEGRSVSSERVAGPESPPLSERDRLSGFAF